MTWIEKAKEAIINSSLESSVYIGCDSDRYKKNGAWYIRYATCIILHKDSKHGALIFHNTVIERDWSNSLRQKLMTEVQHAINAALEVIDVVGDRHIEVHLDINRSEKHKSNIAMKEALGYVKGTLGLDAKCKPEGFAAAHAADHLCRGKSLH